MLHKSQQFQQIFGGLAIVFELLSFAGLVLPEEAELSEPSMLFVFGLQVDLGFHPLELLDDGDELVDLGLLEDLL